jgi:hypothetical protein
VRLGAGASRFLTGLITRFATHDGIPADEQPTAKQTSEAAAGLRWYPGKV